eukprot:TRINITY_DN46436_c0_g1_i1.p1 TRINITY_DN46436_c0_g1~~TRINITY_DN46436_c0_g1_i1.p1  ORF type:complete len:149 (-),score=17.96 TRINITY_DN46436_c0_g1_i1:150-596(-)
MVGHIPYGAIVPLTSRRPGSMDLQIVPNAPNISRHGESSQRSPLASGQGNGRSSDQLAPVVRLSYDDSPPSAFAESVVGQGEQPNVRQYNEPPPADLSSVVDALTALTLAISSRLSSDPASSGRSSSPLLDLLKPFVDVFTGLSLLVT